MQLYKNDRFVGTVSNAKELQDFMFLSNYTRLDIVSGHRTFSALYSRYHGKLTVTSPDCNQYSSAYSR